MSSCASISASCRSTSTSSVRSRSSTAASPAASAWSPSHLDVEGDQVRERARLRHAVQELLQHLRGMPRRFPARWSAPAARGTAPGTPGRPRSTARAMSDISRTPATSAPSSPPRSERQPALPRRGSGAASRRRRAAPARCGRWCPRVQVVDLHLVAVLPLRDREHSPVARERRLDRLPASRAARRDRHRDAGKTTVSRSGSTGSVWFSLIRYAFSWGRLRGDPQPSAGRRGAHFPCQLSVPRTGAGRAAENADSTATFPHGRQRPARSPAPLPKWLAHTSHGAASAPQLPERHGVGDAECGGGRNGRTEPRGAAEDAEPRRTTGEEQGALVTPAQAIVTRRAETRRQYRGAPFAQARSYRAYANRARWPRSGHAPKPCRGR
jgi:hypothetical protein